MTDREWRAHVHAAHLRERLEVAEVANRVLVGALRAAVGAEMKQANDMRGGRR